MALLEIKLLPCPFCGKILNVNDPDVLYPSGIYWRDDELLGIRSYHGNDERHYYRDGVCYAIHCPIPSGGCGAELHGDSKSEVVEKWNTRKCV